MLVRKMVWPFFAKLEMAILLAPRSELFVLLCRAAGHNEGNLIFGFWHKVSHFDSHLRVPLNPLSPGSGPCCGHKSGGWVFSPCELGKGAGLGLAESHGKKCLGSNHW